MGTVPGLGVWLTRPCCVQISNLSPAAASGFTDSCIVATGTVWSGLTPSAAAAITSSACEGFSQQNTHSVNPAAFAGWTSSCVAQLAGGASGACAGFTEAQVCHFRPRRGCMLRMSNPQAQPSVLLPSRRPQVAYFTSANIVGMTDSCVIGTGAVWGKLTTSAAAALTGDACNGFSNGNGASVNPEAFAHFTAQCTAKFTGGSYGACSVFTAAQVRYTGVG